jgi:hypothetical protein
MNSKDPLDNIVKIQMQSRSAMALDRVSNYSLPIIQGSSRNKIQAIMRTHDQGVKVKKRLGTYDHTQSQLVIPTISKLLVVSALDNYNSASDLVIKQIKPKSYKKIFEERVQQCGKTAIIHNLQSVTATDSSIYYDGSDK